MTALVASGIESSKCPKVVYRDYKLTEPGSHRWRLTHRVLVSQKMLTLILVLFLFTAHPALSSPYSLRPWDTSSYCNAPHVNASYYQAAEEGAELIHLTILMRHHKVTYQLLRVPSQ